jgi:hypothetical protein
MQSRTFSSVFIFMSSCICTRCTGTDQSATGTRRSSELGTFPNSLKFVA